MQNNTLKIFRIFVACVTFSLFVAHPVIAQSFQIETSRGIKTVQVPEGQTIEEAYQEVSKLYLEERWDHEDLIKANQDLLPQIDVVNSGTNDLAVLQDSSIQKSKELNTLYETKARPAFLRPLIAIGSNMNFFTNDLSIDLLAGVLILDKVEVSTKLSYPLSFGIQLGVLL